jgi:Ca2+-binding RTX toxin-like protein
MAFFPGTIGNDTFTGTTLSDTFTSGGGGDDNFAGGGGDDNFAFGADFNALDQINGGVGNDVLRLDGNHIGINALFFAPTTMVKVETILCAGGFAYDLTFNDATVAAGASLTVDHTAGTAGTGGLIIDGSAETNGSYALLGGGDIDVLIGGALKDKIYSGGAGDSLRGLAGDDIMRGQAGVDFLEGGLGADTLNGGAASDTLIYNPVADSTSVNYDTVQGFDFAGVDQFQLPVVVAGADPLIPVGALSTATFDADLAAAVNAGTLTAGNAVLFTPSAGTLAGAIFLVVDANGAGGYQASADYVMQLVGPANLGAFGATDFI